jgi:hypothetical protein
MPTKHSNLGASSAHRWLACPGSVAAIDALPIGDTSSPFAIEGTAAHELSEICLISGEDAEAWIGKPLVEMPDWVVDEEMAEYVQVYLDYCRAIGKDADEVFIEQTVSYEDWVPQGFGTNDFGALMIKDKRIKIADLKYGKGVQVDAENNPQAMLYALGTYAEYGWVSEFDYIDIAIVQPRLYHISEWTISVKDLLKWAEWVSQRAEIALSKDAERVPGEKQCRFCEAKPTCKALMKYTEDIIMAEFDDLDDMPSPDTLTDAQLRKVLETKSLIEGWLSSVETVVRERLEGGEPFDGFKLVEGRSLRKWGNEQTAAEVLTETLGVDVAFKSTLISPAQAEKALKKDERKLLDDLVVKPAGKPTLVPESDKRPAINLTEGDFEDVSSG